MSDKPEKIYIEPETSCSGRYWTHKALSGSTEYIRADLAKPSEWISVEQVRLLLGLIPEWATIVPKGLDPTFYGTCSYEGDMEIKAKVDEIIELLPPKSN